MQFLAPRAPPTHAAPGFLIQQAGVEWGLRSCIFNKSPGDSDADGLGPWSEYLDIEQEQKTGQLDTNT